MSPCQGGQTGYVSPGARIPIPDLSVAPTLTGLHPFRPASQGNSVVEAPSSVLPPQWPFRALPWPRVSVACRAPGFPLGPGDRQLSFPGTRCSSAAPGPRWVPSAPGSTGVCFLMAGLRRLPTLPSHALRTDITNHPDEGHGVHLHTALWAIAMDLHRLGKGMKGTEGWV